MSVDHPIRVWVLGYRASGKTAWIRRLQGYSFEEYPDIGTDPVPCKFETNRGTFHFEFTENQVPTNIQILNLPDAVVIMGEPIHTNNNRKWLTEVPVFAVDSMADLPRTYHLGSSFSLSAKTCFHLEKPVQAILRRIQKDPSIVIEERPVIPP